MRTAGLRPGRGIGMKRLMLAAAIAVTAASAADAEVFVIEERIRGGTAEFLLFPTPGPAAMVECNRLLGNKMMTANVIDPSGDRRPAGTGCWATDGRAIHVIGKMMLTGEIFSATLPAVGARPFVPAEDSPSQQQQDEIAPVQSGDTAADLQAWAENYQARLLDQAYISAGKCHFGIKDDGADPCEQLDETVEKLHEFGWRMGENARWTKVSP